MKSKFLLILAAMSFVLMEGCSSGYIETSDPNNNFRAIRDKRKAALDAGRRQAPPPSAPAAGR